MVGIPNQRQARRGRRSLVAALALALGAAGVGAASPAATRAAAPSWGPVQTLTTGGYRIEQVRAAANPDGSYTVVWVDTSDEDTPPDGWNHRVMAVDVTPSGVTEAVVLGGVPGSIIEEQQLWDQPEPELGGLQVATDASGVTTVVWTERRTDGDGGATWGPHVLSVDRAPGGSWSAPAQLSQRRGSGPRVAVSSGHAVAVWKSLRRGAMSAYRAPGESWQAPVPTPIRGARWALGLDDAGVAVVAFSSGARVRTSDLVESGTTWTEPTTIGDRKVGPLDLAVNDRGDAVITWEHHWGSPHGEGWAQIDAIHRTAGGHWGRVHHVSEPQRWGSLHPLVALDRRGRATATWVQGDDAVVKAARRRPTQGWGQPMTLGHDSRSNAVPITAGPRGDVVAAWIVRRDRVTRADAAFRARGDEWQDVGPVSPRDEPPDVWGVADLVAAVTSEGDVGVAWPRNGKWPASSRRVLFRELTP